MKLPLLLSLALLTAACAHHPEKAGSPVAPLPSTVAAALPEVVVEQVELFDSARRRLIPLALYQPAKARAKTPLKAAIISHGYGGRHTGYSFLANNLVAHGYFVASIQHELPGDAPLAMTGNIYEARQPVWERGGQNIRFVLQQLRPQYPQVDFRQLLLLGHSNGGDISLRFARTYPEQVQKVVSLDSRRMPFPRSRTPQVLSLRSSDQQADPGVLPTPAEQAAAGTTIVLLPATIHNDMWDGASAAQKQEMNDIISRFLEE
jgi:predicted dienelactone hydrolase